MLPAKLREIRYDHALSLRIDEASIRLLLRSLPAVYMGPSSVATDAPLHNGYHVRIVQTIFAAESGQVCDRIYKITFRIDEAFISLDIVSLANAVFVCPALVGLQFALAHCESVHGRKTQLSLATKIVQVRNCYLISFRVNKSFPNLNVKSARHASNFTNIEANLSLNTPRAIYPFLLYRQQVLPIHKLQHRTLEIFLPVFIPRVLQILVWMLASPQLAPMVAPPPRTSTALPT
jgi:hypothetical protein